MGHAYWALRTLQSRVAPRARSRSPEGTAMTLISMLLMTLWMVGIILGFTLGGFIHVLAFGAVIAMTAVLLVFQLGQPRILMAMSRDGLLSPWFGRIHPRYRTPHVTTILTGIFVAFWSAIANIEEIVQLTNIGTLFAFILVCIGIMILRVREPGRPRKFRAPWVPVTPVLGIGMCVVLMAGLPMLTWIRFLLWLVAGLVIYFLYGIRQSRLHKD